MVHDPSRASVTDLEALRADGLAMQAEGQIMAAHGQLMTKDIDLMITKHKMAVGAVAELRKVAETVQQVGGWLAANGQEVIDYADRLRRSLGYSD